MSDQQPTDEQITAAYARRDQTSAALTDLTRSVHMYAEHEDTAAADAVIEYLTERTQAAALDMSLEAVERLAAVTHYACERSTDVARHIRREQRRGRWLAWAAAATLGGTLTLTAASIAAVFSG